jgi:hypothetical protein
VSNVYRIVGQLPDEFEEKRILQLKNPSRDAKITGQHIDGATKQLVYYISSIIAWQII